MPTSRRMYDFHCEDHCGIYFEDLVYEFEKEAKCPNCGKTAKRVISPANIWWRKMGVSNDFPTAALKWEKMQYQKSRKDKGGVSGDGQPNLKEY